MSATFFGDSSQPLFGYYHPPRGTRTRDVAVLLCSPGPQEYMRTHWAFRRLAKMLTRVGFSVFRFDYHGTGDSAGATDSGSLDLWRGDVVTAAQELRDLAAVSKVSAIGFRVGAMLAATSGARFQDLVLWEPLVNGHQYLAHLETIQASYLQINPRPAWRLHDRPEELLGFPMSRAHEAELRAVELRRAPSPNASRVTVAISESSAPVRELVDAWSRSGATAKVLEVPEEEGSGRKDDLQAALLSNTMLNALVTVLS